MSEETSPEQSAAPAVLSIDVDGEHVGVLGTQREDAAVHQILTEAGFSWSRSRRAWVLRRNLRPITRRRAVEQITQALAVLGRRVLIQDSGTDQSAQERRAAGADRLSARAVRLDRQAQATEASAERNRAVAERIWAGYAGGPILEDHHSAPKHRRDLDRADKSLRAALDGQALAQEQARLARQIREHQQAGVHPVTLKRRLHAKRQSLRGIHRAIARSIPSGQTTHLRAEAALLSQEIALDEGVLADLVAAGETRNWGPGDFRPGDGVRFHGDRIHEVTRVNPTTLTVATTPTTARKAPYLIVSARQRAGVIQTAADLLALETPGASR